MKFSGLILLAFIPLSVLAKSDYKGPKHLVGASQDSKQAILTCFEKRKLQWSNLHCRA